MSGTINRVDLLGRLGGEPEMRYTNSGLAVTNLSLATDRRRKDGASSTDWHRVVCWGKTAESVNEYVGKGDQLFVTGSLIHDSYQTDDGQTRYYTEVHAQRVVFLGSRNGNGREQIEHDAEGQATPAAQAEPVASPF